jgi:hypothetical protein
VCSQTAAPRILERVPDPMREVNVRSRDDRICAALLDGNDPMQWVLAALGVRHVAGATQHFVAVTIEKLAGQYDLSGRVMVVDTPACRTLLALEREGLSLRPGPTALLVPNTALRTARGLAELLASAIRIMDSFSEKGVSPLLAANRMRRLHDYLNVGFCIKIIPFCSHIPPYVVSRSPLKPHTHS